MPEDKEDVVRVLRLIEYEGPRWSGGPNETVRITAVTLSEFPEIIEEARRTPDPHEVQELRTALKIAQKKLGGDNA